MFRKICTAAVLLIYLSACGEGPGTEPPETRYIEWDLADTSQWQVSGHDYEHLMTLTAVITLNGEILSSVRNRVVGYSGGSIRSNAVSYWHLDQQLYSLNLYSNTLTDTLKFAAWIEDLGMAVSIENPVIFEANAALGHPDSPFELLIEKEE